MATPFDPPIDSARLRLAKSLYYLLTEPEPVSRNGLDAATLTSAVFHAALTWGG